MREISLNKKDLERMQKKKNNICIELGSGYDWMLVDSLIAINKKIEQTETKIEELL